MLRLRLLLLAVLLLPGIASSETPMNYAVLIITRDRLEVATPCDIGIYLQDQLVARLYQGQATSFNLPAGKLSIRMGMLGGIGCIPAFEQIRGEHIELKAGEVLALVGENGAGKSTLMNVLYGLYQADAGEILLDDKPVKFSGPGDAMAAGIGMVHQHFMLIPVFTVAENVVLGHEPTRAGGFLDLAAARAKVIEISNRFGFDLDPDATVGDLPVGVQQRVELGQEAAQVVGREVAHQGQRAQHQGV